MKGGSEREREGGRQRGDGEDRKLCRTSVYPSAYRWIHRQIATQCRRRRNRRRRSRRRRRRRRKGREIHTGAAA